MKTSAENLTGHFLIAMPGMADPRFTKSVVYLCAHSDEGAMGLIVNKPSPKIQFTDLLKQLDIPCPSTTDEIRVHFGGPVETGRGFVLHSSDYTDGEGTMQVNDDIALTATTDVLKAMVSGTGPADSLLALGYAGWGEGQLEGELLQNGWLTVKAEPDIVFSQDASDKWTQALGLLGINPLHLSETAGHA